MKTLMKVETTKLLDNINSQNCSFREPQGMQIARHAAIVPLAGLVSSLIATSLSIFFYYYY